MTANEILAFIDPSVLIIIPVLIIIGTILKANKNLNDWTIPIILTVVSVILAVGLICLTSGFTPANILNAIIQGVLCAGMAVYVHQLKIQTIDKRD